MIWATVSSRSCFCWLYRAYNRQIRPWNTEWSRAKANRVLPRECVGHSKHPLPTTQEKTLHMDITRWSTMKSDVTQEELKRWVTSSCYCCCCSVAKSCPTPCNTMNCSMPGLPVPLYLLEFAQLHVLWVSDFIQPSHPLLPFSPLAFNLPQHQGLFQWVSSLHQVTRVLEPRLHHQSFQWMFSFYFLQDWLGWSPCYPTFTRIQ